MRNFTGEAEAAHTRRLYLRQKERWLTPQWRAIAWARRQLQGREAPWNSGVAEVAEREKIYVPLLTSACLKHADLQQFITISLLYE